MKVTTVSDVQVYRGRGNFEGVTLPAFLSRLEQYRSGVNVPFSPERVRVIGDLSARLLADRHVLERPALAYFAHWTRRAAVRELESRFRATTPANTIAAPRGVVFHVPPKNVETIFLFSWVSSYLAGNSNIVRLPSDFGGAGRDAVDLLIELTSSNNPNDLFVSYPPVPSINEAVSRESDVRVVWGGDEKVRAFETLPLRNGGKSLWFGDRYSYAVVSGAALASAAAGEMAALAKSLTTDIFTFDQMGCSSPHKIFVVGSVENDGSALAALLDAVRTEAHRRGVQIPASHSIRKLTEALVLAGVEPGTSVPTRAGELMSVMIPHLRRSDDRVGGGFVVVEFIPDLSSLLEIVRAGHQTVTYYGFPKEELERFARAATLTGISRIVPIGQALSFDVVWDGYDLLRELTRTIRLA